MTLLLCTSRYIYVSFVQQKLIDQLLGRVRCRIPSGSPVLKQLSIVLQNKTADTEAFFAVKEQGHDEVKAFLSSRELEDMSRRQDFQSPLITIKLSSQTGCIEARLHFNRRENFMISGLPRRPLQTATRKSKSSQAMKIMETID